MGDPVGFDAASIPATTSAGNRPNLQPAYLQLFEPSSDGSMSAPGAKAGKIEFQFNPKELTLAKTATWARRTGHGHSRSAPPQFTGPQPLKLTLEMFFDASLKQDNSVVTAVERLFECCVPTSSSARNNIPSPPWVKFRWGGLTGFLAHISSVSAKYTLFSAAGTPIRAVCTVTLDELAGEPPGQNPTSGGLVPRRLHQVVGGDSLAGIAFTEYGDATLWRAVARANGIDDPMRLRPGVRLFLPALNELVPHPDTANRASRREVARAR